MTLGQFWHACRCKVCRHYWMQDFWRWIDRRFSVVIVAAGALTILCAIGAAFGL